MKAHVSKQASSSNEQSWICSNCGKENRSNRSFCWNCEALKDSLEFIPPRSEENSQPQPSNEPSMMTQTHERPRYGADDTAVRGPHTNYGPSLIGSETSNADSGPDHRRRRITGSQILRTALIVVGVIFVAALIKVMILWIQGYYRGQNPYTGNTIQYHLVIIGFFSFMQMMGILIIARGVQLYQGKVRPISLSLSSLILSLLPQRKATERLTQKIQAIGMVIIGLMLLYYMGPALVLFIIFPIR